MPTHLDTKPTSHANDISLENSLKGQIIAHRGAPVVAPENTLSGFKVAASMQARWVEFDTQSCGSQEWVIMHDQTLDRTTNGTGRVADTPYAILKGLDAGTWFDAKFKGEPILLLSELLQALQALGLSPNIEVKYFESSEDKNGNRSNNHKERSLALFVDTVAQNWPAHLTPPLVSSFDVETLAILKNIAPHLKRGLIVDRVLDNTLEAMEKLECFSLHCDYENLQTGDMDSLLTHKKRVLLYTINDPLIAKRVLAEGVTAIFSDYPNLLSLPSTQSSTQSSTKMTKSFNKD